MKLSDKVQLLNVVREGQTIASATFMLYKNYCHYHLAGGSLVEYRKYAPNNILLWEAIRLAKESNVKYFHFGGGRTSDPDDTLLKFKSSFSSSLLKFKIGKRIHNPLVYKYLIDTWEKKYNKKQKLFLQYKVCE